MKRMLFIFLLLVYACGEHDASRGNDSRHEVQELEQKVASLNQVIREMADEITSLQAKIDALNGMLADCEQAEAAATPTRPSESEQTSESAAEPAEANRQQKLLDFFGTRESLKK